ncbi:hypothetical protein E0765_06190 [Sulfuricurvum sp. IAE1]|uniref:hypothetical protein n=1 Tax=Sulfuricurvum sp. IAE1 TaxID=2546102 RepID=UPI00104AF3A1|nr:hypothetical protein [Sulfuricurvum sp. IAE1]TDA64302.1 hypothetical protein E0765_06190 [Sulfuricurvum sp. IAE1]
MNALEILQKTRSQIEDDHEFAQVYDAAIAEVEELTKPKTCETCKQYLPWECTDGSVLDIGSCQYGIRYGRELVDECYRGFVKEDFGCTEYSQKDIK